MLDIIIVLKQLVKKFLTKNNTNISLRIKKPSLIALTFLTPAILHFSCDAIEVYIILLFCILIGNSTQNLKSLLLNVTFFK